MGVIAAVGLGLGGGASYELGPATNNFGGASLTAAQTARDNYAVSEDNADWLHSYATDRSLVVQLSPTGITESYAYLSSVDISNYLLVGASANVTLQAYSEITGSRDTDGDLTIPSLGSVQSMASSGTRVYVLASDVGGANARLLAFDHAGAAQTSETLNLTSATGRVYTGVAVTSTRIYIAYTEATERGSAANAAMVLAYDLDRNAQTSENQDISGFIPVTPAGYIVHDITATATRRYVLGGNAPNTTVYVTDASWARQTSEEWSPGSGSYSAIEYHQDYFYILETQQVRAWSEAAAGAAATRASGRDFSVSFQSGSVPRAIGAYYNVANAVWTQVVLQGPAGQRGPTGAMGATGADATVDAASVLTAMQGFDNTQEGQARTAIGADTSSIVSDLEGLTGGDRLASTAVRGLPTVDAPSVLTALQGFDSTQEGQARTAIGIDGARIVELLVALSGAARLPAGAVRDLPSGGGGLDTDAVNALIAAYGQPFSATEETKLAGIETGATADQTAAEIVTALQGLNGNDRLQAAAIRGLVTTLLDLSDTPSSYTGDGGDYLRVNSGETAIEFVVAPSGGTPPPATHTRFAGASADTTFIASEFTTPGVTTDTLTLPTFTANRYVAFAVPDSTGDITGIHPVGNTLNQIGGFQRVPGTLVISGETCKVWRSNSAFFPRTSGTQWVITQAA